MYRPQIIEDVINVLRVLIGLAAMAFIFLFWVILYHFLIIIPLGG